MVGETVKYEFHWGCLHGNIRGISRPSRDSAGIPLNTAPIRAEALAGETPALHSIGQAITGKV
jgi:hypothetical protein